METLMDQLMDGIAPQDRVGLELSAPSLTHAVWVPLMRRDQITIERMFSHIEKARLDKASDRTINWQNIRKGFGEQKKVAKTLHVSANVPEVARFQQFLTEYQILVITETPQDPIMFRGPEKDK
ncbi:hypothetical protein HOLleu_13810 [Holothuria leucospilota]|uniref:Uncharacterized protein n=1 Tax=Holothuria leucospilota TaxID=206669 RepID=A0A9Q1H8I8_HOLLE|nr:hypothetical protein HOLleu_13810 [Holothuria leucospilota]